MFVEHSYDWRLMSNDLWLVDHTIILLHFQVGTGSLLLWIDFAFASAVLLSNQSYLHLLEIYRMIDQLADSTPIFTILLVDIDIIRSVYMYKRDGVTFDNLIVHLIDERQNRRRWNKWRRLYQYETSWRIWSYFKTLPHFSENVLFISPLLYLSIRVKNWRLHVYFRNKFSPIEK